MAIGITGATDYLLRGPLSPIPSLGRHTTTFWLYLDSYPASGRPLYMLLDGGGGVMGLYLSNAGQLIAVATAGSAGLGAAGDIKLRRWVQVGFVSDGTSLFGFIDGKYIGQAFYAPSFGTVFELMLGDGGGIIPGRVANIMSWRQAFTFPMMRAQFRSLRPITHSQLLNWATFDVGGFSCYSTATPENWSASGPVYYRPFNRFGKSLRPAVGTAATNNTYAGSLTDTLALTDTLGGRLTLGGAFAETLTLTETLSSRTTQNVSTTDSLTLVDSSSGQAVLGGALGESLTLTDALDGLRAVAGSVDETLSLSETLGGQSVLGGTATEALSLTDSESSQVVVGGALSDALTLLDSEGGQLVSGGAVSESLTFSDSLDGARALTGDLSETLSLTDSESGQAVLGGAASDSLSLTDESSSQVTFAGELAETATLSDTSGGQATLLGELVETETLTDTLSGELESEGTFSGSLSETLTLSDSFDSTVIVQGALEESLPLSDTLSGLGGQDVISALPLGGDLIGGGRRRHRGKNWKDDDERRKFWEILEDEFTELVSPTPAPAARPHVKRTVKETSLLAAALAGPEPARNVPSKPSVLPKKASISASDDEEFEEMILLVSNL